MLFAQCPPFALQCIIHPIKPQSICMNLIGRKIKLGMKARSPAHPKTGCISEPNPSFHQCGFPSKIRRDSLYFKHHQQRAEPPPPPEAVCRSTRSYVSRMSERNKFQALPARRPRRGATLPLAKHQCGFGLHVIVAGGRAADEHGGATVAAQGVLQDACHLAVTVRHVAFLQRG